MLFTLPTHSAKKVSSANLTRSFRRAPKHAGEADDGVVGAGLCHLCECGQGIDWEDLSFGVLNPLSSSFTMFVWCAGLGFGGKGFG